MKAAASATKEGDHGNRKKKGHLQFISNFEVCESHRLRNRSPLPKTIDVELNVVGPIQFPI